MNIKLATIGAMMMGGGIIYAGSMADRKMNYVETEATITEAKVDCFVKNGKSKLVERSTDKLAYMACDEAEVAARVHGYPSSAVQERYKLKFSYVSAADGSRQNGSYETEYGEYKRGQKIKIYSHKTEPKTMRWI